jgi:proton-dependent oligopeptide transporter, POT family
MTSAVSDNANAKPKRSKLPQTFWIANTMEIFERLAWYGFFAVSSLYITGSVTEGALGFSDEDRGILQGIIPFILYLIPVITGALADRFGYKRSFLIAYAMLVPAYFLLGQVTSYAGFFAAFLFVAVGAAIFKPVVVGTVARTTDDSNSSMGFGIFYMMVNIGGFLGPIVAGIVRTSLDTFLQETFGWDVQLGWNWVFIACSFWISLNFIWVIFFYKEPTTESTSKEKRTINKVLIDMVDVFGNYRFFILIFVLIILFMIAGGQLSWLAMGGIVVIWIILNLIVDIPIKKQVKNNPNQALQPIKLHNWRFGLYLLILSGFWTSFNQIFITMPQYIRDFVDTRDLIDSFVSVFGTGAINAIAAVDVSNIVDYLKETLQTFAGAVPNPDMLADAVDHLRKLKVAVTPEFLQETIANLQTAGGLENEGAMKQTADVLIQRGQQVNPEYIVNVDAGAIVVFQVLVSIIISRFKPLPTMVTGIIISAIGIGASAFLHSGWPVIIAIAIFAFGEMTASPKSQEYVGRIAPPKKVAMYMGYYFVSMALGNIFGGRLSGELYDYFAVKQNQPEYMWIIFGILGILTAIALVLFNVFALKKGDEMREKDE